MRYRKPPANKYSKPGAVVVRKGMELHLRPAADFPKKMGKRVKDIGGTYSHCRGNSMTRYVHLPWSDEGCDLLGDILSGEEQPITVVFQHGMSNVQSWICVHRVESVEDLEVSYQKALDSAVRRGLLLEFEGLTDDERRAEGLAALQSHSMSAFETDHIREADGESHELYSCGTFSFDGTPVSEDIEHGVAMLDQEMGVRHTLAMKTIQRIVDGLYDDPAGISNMNNLEAHDLLGALPDTKRAFEFAQKLSRFLKEEAPQPVRHNVEHHRPRLIPEPKE